MRGDLMVNGAKIFGIPQRQDGDHNVGEEDGQTAEGSILAKCLHQLQDHHYANHNIEDGNEEQKIPPAGSADQFQLDDDVVVGDEGCPAGLAGFDEQTPDAVQVENHQSHNEQK